VEDYPRTVQELEQRFSTEEACRKYLFDLRWPEGFVCPRCVARKAWPTERGLWVCAECEYQVSVTAGTVFEATRYPLSDWFRAMWYVTSQKNGTSALGLQRVLGLGSYQTAWAWLHKLRRAMVRPGREPLGGVVEVDETYLGGLEEGRHGRHTEKKAIVVIAAEEGGPGIGRIRMRRVLDLSSDSLLGFIENAVGRGSTVRTDGFATYKALPRRGYPHTVKVIGSNKQRASEELPLVHRVASLLKRWLLGTHQGAVGHEHLDYYLDEFTFRFNRRTCASRGKLFYRLVQQAVQVGPHPYRVLVKPQDVGAT
jgi:transposase-like protein